MVAVFNSFFNLNATLCYLCNCFLYTLQAATKFQSRQTKKKSIAVARGLPAIMVSSTDSKKMEPLMTSNLHSSTSSTPSSLPSNFSQETLTSQSSSLDESSAVTTTSLASTDNVLTVDTNVQSDSPHVNEVLSQQRTPSPAVIVRLKGKWIYFIYVICTGFTSYCQFNW